MLESLLFLAPLPVLMLLLYKTKATLDVSRKRQVLALATASTIGLFLALPKVIGLFQATQRALPFINSVAGSTEADRLWGWLHNFFGFYAWDAFAIPSDVALALFLVSLARITDNSPFRDNSSARNVRRSALIATVMGGLAVVLNLYGQISSAVRFSPQRDLFGIVLLDEAETRLHFIWRHSFSIIPLLCWFTTAWIVFKGIPPHLDKFPTLDVSVEDD
jgi:hypothetical protein